MPYPAAFQPPRLSARRFDPLSEVEQALDEACSAWDSLAERLAAAPARTRSEDWLVEATLDALKDLQRATRILDAIGYGVDAQRRTQPENTAPTSSAHRSTSTQPREARPEALGR